MSIFADAIDNIAEKFLRGAIQKAAAGWAAQGYITADQEPVLVQGAMDEIQIALKMYQASQAKAQP